MYDRKLRVKRVAKYCLLAGGWIALNVILAIPGYLLDLGGFSEFAKGVIENGSIPLLLCGIVPNVVLALNPS